MKHSVRLKLFFYLCAIVALFVVFSYALNTLFLGNFYIRTKQKALVDMFYNIKNNYSGNIDALSLKLEKDENAQQVRILMLDSSYKVIYSSTVNTKNAPQFSGKHQPYSNIVKSHSKQFTEKPTIEKKADTRLSMSFLSLYGKTSENGKPVYIMISTPVAAMNGSASIANEFYLFTGIITLIFGGILIFFLSKKITRPVLEINEATARLSNLEFSQKISVKSNDELGQLGRNINSLSEKLESSITRLQSANAQLQKDIREKEKIDEMRKEFVSNVSHELKTPLSVIIGYSEGLKVNVNEKEKDFYCDVISDEAQKMNKLVIKLLDLSHLESGFVHLSMSRFHILELINEDIERNRLVLDEKGITVENELGDTVVSADRDLIEQVFANIFGNAVNYVDEKKLIRVSGVTKGDRVVINVFNTGSHIPEESLDKIWESFYKVDKSRSREYGGSGLGLSIVKSIEDAHGCACGAENVEGGVNFFFEIKKATPGSPREN